MVSKVGYGLRNQASERLSDISGDTTFISHDFYLKDLSKLLGYKKYTYLGPTARNPKSAELG